MVVNAGGPPSDFFINSRSGRHSVKTTKEFAAHDGYIFGDEHEKYYVRLRVGFNF